MNSPDECLHEFTVTERQDKGQIFCAMYELPELRKINRRTDQTQAFSNSSSLKFLMYIIPCS